MLASAAPALSLLALCLSCGGGSGSSGTPTQPSTPSFALTLESVRLGVVSTPAQATSYPQGTAVNYRFVTRDGTSDVFVTMDAARVAPSGTVIMDRTHVFRAAVDIDPGAQALDISGPTWDGRTVRLSDYRGKIVLVDFSAITCEGSIIQAPALRGYYNTYHARGLEIITVLQDCPALHDCPANQLPTSDQLRVWQQTYNLPFPVISDPGNLTRVFNYSEKDKASSFPSNYLIDGAGVIRYRFAGFQDVAIKAALAALFP
jgi:peroxiredoxin